MKIKSIELTWDFRYSENYMLDQKVLQQLRDNIKSKNRNR